MAEDTIPRPNLYQLYQQMGEMVGEMRSLTTALRDAHAENRGRFATLENEVRTTKHEMRNHQQVVNNHLAKVDVSITQLDRQVRALEPPVKEMVALRIKLGAAAAFIMSLGAVLAFFVEPLWRFLSEHLLASLFERTPH